MSSIIPIIMLLQEDVNKKCEIQRFFGAVPNFYIIESMFLARRS